MTNETNTTSEAEEPIYVAPAIISRLSVTREEIKMESAMIEKEGIRALLVFRNAQDAENYRREEGLYPQEEGFKVLPVEDAVLRDFLQRHGCTHVVTPISFLEDDSVDLYPAEGFMRILEERVPA